MIFLDSWIWLEFIFDGDRAERAGEVIERAAKAGGVLAATVLTEVAYRVRRETDGATADVVVDAIERLENVEVVPVTGDVARRVAVIRDRYYERGRCELSYADAIHATTAKLTGCTELYSGDPDFESLANELDVVVV